MKRYLQHSVELLNMQIIAHYKNLELERLVIAVSLQSQTQDH